MRSLSANATGSRHCWLFTDSESRIGGGVADRGRGRTHDRRAVSLRAFVSCVLVFAGAAVCSSKAPEPRALGISRPTYHDGARFAVAGDGQRTSKLEALREKNDPERRRILEGIAEAEPDLVAFTGDLVFDGGSDGHWAELDDLAAPIRSRNIPVIAAFGNHEYWGGRKPAEKNVFARFPVLERKHWYTVAFGPLHLVFLDSNETRLEKTDWEAQKKWYEETLDTADASADTRGVLVLLHHPPFTNSTVTGDEKHVQRTFLPAFLRAKKTLGMLSGHVHNYERFAKGGKMFIVSGGGGGPRQKRATG